MKFTLKDYQEDAVADVLDRLKKARQRWRREGEKNAFSLTAPTGAGKTVMAASVFEALFHGSDAFEFDRDPGAVVLWFCDDPALNEQTRFRLLEASDRLRHTDLVVIENTFCRATFQAGKIHFLNTQKLSKSSLLVRGFDDAFGDGVLPGLPPDTRSHAIWDTIRNTIEDPALTLYLVLDEAHRGMGKTHEDKQTIVKRLINGEKGVPGIPVVWGISATVERFNTAMKGAKDRSTLPPVTVDNARVQDSGLLKDTLALDIPEEPVGDFDTVLVRRAADKLKESTEQWAAYAAHQEHREAVVPLMVLQAPNTPSSNDLGRALETIFQRYPGLNETAVAHVFGEHTTQTFGKFKVPYIEPQRVQEDKSVRVLVAKEAISTGWDCPRAEVMVSFRRASDETHIAQLLGRMVRTPMARRIPGNEKLNAVHCLLPNFDREAVQRVVEALHHGGAEAPQTGRVLIRPAEMTPNPDVPEAVWDCFTSLPAQTRPQRTAKPAVRLTALAHELVMDGLLPGAGQKAHAAMHAWLDRFVEESAEAFDEKRAAVTTVQGRTVIADLQNASVEDETFEMEADDSVLGDAYRRSARILSPDIARTYVGLRADRKPEEDDEFDEALLEASEEVAALHLMENLQVLYDEEAEKLSAAWFAEFHDRIKALPDARQDAYRQVIALSRAPQDVDVARPVSRYEPTTVQEAGAFDSLIPTYEKHLLCDANGEFPADLRKGEKRVLEAEMGREGFRFWYRNPDRPAQDSLGIAYEVDGDVRIVRPDFVFFAEADGEIVADIVDPHGHHLADALPKLRGLAVYAESHPGQYRRIEAIGEVGEKLRVLDLTDADTRAAVRIAANAESLYKGAIAGDYPSRSQATGRSS